MCPHLEPHSVFLVEEERAEGEEWKGVGESETRFFWARSFGLKILDLLLEDEGLLGVWDQQIDVLETQGFS